MQGETRISHDPQMSIQQFTCTFLFKIWFGKIMILFENINMHCSAYLWIAFCLLVYFHIPARQANTKMFSIHSYFTPKKQEWTQVPEGNIGAQNTSLIYAVLSPAQNLICYELRKDHLFKIL